MAPKFVIIGKPNHGKSSLISVITMDDSIEISNKAGTTIEMNHYSYEYKNEDIIEFYDTPGFEMAEDITDFLEEGHSINEFIEKYHNDNIYKKDIEILNAVLKSDYIIFLINSSEMPDENTIGYELTILKYIDKPKLFLFNQKKEKNYNKKWEELLKEFGFNKNEIIYFNALKSGYSQIIDLLQKIETLTYSKKIINTFQEDFCFRIKKSIEYIVDMLSEFYTLEVVSNSKENTEKLFYIKIQDIEKKYRKKIMQNWGYNKVDFEISLKNLASTDYKTIANEGILSLSKSQIITIGAVIGTILVGWMDGGIGVAAIFGGVSGGGIAWYFADKFIEFTEIKNLISGKTEYKASLEIKNVNNISIYTNPQLQFIHQILSHGHANREIITMPKRPENWIYDNKTFNNNEISSIFKALSNIKKDNNVLDAKNNLKEILCKKIKEKESIIEDLIKDKSCKNGLNC